MKKAELASSRLLHTDAEYQAARAIVQHMYEMQGYEVNSQSFERYLDSSNAATFGLFKNDTLYGTISIIFDSVHGLPMDSIYASELAPWRSAGKKLVEVVQFAVDHEIFTTISGEKASLFVAIPLFAAVLSRANQENVDYLCISINPKHDRFYSLLGFKQIGEQRHYDSVNAPAIARALSVSDAKNNPVIAQFLRRGEKI